MILTRYRERTSIPVPKHRSSVPKNLRLLAEINKNSALPALKVLNTCDCSGDGLYALMQNDMIEQRDRVYMRLGRFNTLPISDNANVNNKKLLCQVTGSDYKKLSYVLSRMLFCQTPCDFSKLGMDEENEKCIKQKLKYFSQLVETVDYEYEEIWLSDIVNKQFEVMVSVNLMQNNTIPSAQIATVDEIGLIDSTAMEHNILIYDLIIKLIRLFKGKYKPSQQIVNLLITMLKCPSIKERTSVMSIINTIVDYYPEYAESITKKCFFLICEYLENKEEFFAIEFVLSFLQNRIVVTSGKFPVNMHEIIMAVTSLVSSPYLRFYSSKLISFLTVLCIKYSMITKEIILRLIKRFPLANISNQLSIISFINELLNYITKSQLMAIYVPLFRLYAKCARSVSWKVAKMSFEIWNIQKIRPYIAIIASNIYPTMYKSICDGIASDTNLRAPGSIALSEMSTINKNEYTKTLMNQKEAPTDKRIIGWKMIADCAFDENGMTIMNDFKNAIGKIQEEYEKYDKSS
jgi:hypothetical protein